MKKITFVTGNINKLNEIRKLLAENQVDIEILSSSVELKELQADNLEEVAEFKLLSVKGKIEPPYIIEDAGFFVDDVCNGFPGVYSSYVMKTIGYDGILKILGDKDTRKAHFESVIGYMDEKLDLHFFKGINEGKVAIKAKGSSGFGFDPIFISKDSPEKTFAELSMQEKNKISHRRRAMMKFITFLKQNSMI